MKLSVHWRAFLRKLDEAGPAGLPEWELDRKIIGQMYVNDVGYYERSPTDRTRIRISKAGKEALG